MRQDLRDYLESLTLTQGRRAGERLRLLPWERRFLTGALRPGVGEAALSIGRGNGKTAVVAALAAAAVDGPLRVPRGEVVLVASSFAQSRVAFEDVLAFLPQTADRSEWRVQDTGQTAAIEHRATGARVRCIASDPRRAHGLRPVLALLDEPAQWPHTTAEAMVAAIRTSMGKIPGSRLIMLGTRPSEESHFFNLALNGGADYAQLHAAERDAPPFARKTLLKANPSLPHMPDLAEALRREAELAKRDPSMLAAWRALRLNMGVSDTVESTLLDADVWAGIEGDADADGSMYWGVDLGTSAAQSAIAAYWPRTGRLAAVAAFPSVPSLEERGLRDGVGRLYAECARRGELLTLGQNAVDVYGLVRAAYGLWGAPAGIASDRWREAELRDALKTAALPLARLDLRGQGFKDGAEDVRTFQRGCLEGKVTPAPSLLLASAMAEARVVSDVSGNAKLAKGSEGGRRQRARDDAAAAAILAVSLGLRTPQSTRRLSLGLAG